MPLTKQETQITWGTNPSTSVAAGGTATSDTYSVGANATNLSVMIEADNNSATPAADAKLEVYQLASAGDVNSDNVDDFETTGHASLIASMDVSSGGEDPARRVVDLNPVYKAFQLYVKNTGATDGITVRARVIEQQAS